MKKNCTELVFILDRSGSMHGLVGDTIGGFNSVVEKQRAQEGEVLVTTVLFDHEIFTLHDRLPIADVAAITEKEYSTRGTTALLDAMGTTIRHIAKIHKYARPEDVPEHTIFVVITDGMENASRRYRAEEVRTLVEKEKEKYGWEFLFLGANMDAIATARGLGIEEDNAVNYIPDAEGTRLSYEAVGCAVHAMREYGRMRPSKNAWKKSLDADYSRRSGR